MAMPAPGEQWRRALGRRWGLLAAIVALSLACGWGVLWCRQPMYAAHAAVTVRATAPELQFAAAAPAAAAPDMAAVATVAEGLGSRAVAAAALARMGPRADGLYAPPMRRPHWLRQAWPQSGPATAEGWLQLIMGRVRIATVPQSRVIQMSFTAPRPELAAAFLRELTAAYLARAAARRHAQGLSRVHYLQTQAQQARLGLQASEHALEEVAAHHGLGDPVAELAVASQRWQQLSAAATSAQLAALEQAAALAHGAPAAPASSPNQIQGVPADLLVRRATLAATIERLAAQYRPQAAPLLEARRQLAALDASLKQLRAQRLQARQDALAAVQQQTRNLRQALLRQRHDQTRLRTAVAAFDLAQSQVEAQRKVYSALLEQLHQAIAAAGEIAAPLGVADPAAAPARPLAPRLAPTLASALVLGILFGLLTAWSVDHRRDGVRWPEVEELGVPLAAVLPRHGLPSPGASPSTPPAGRLPFGRVRRGQREREEVAFTQAVDHCAAALLLAQSEAGVGVVHITSTGAGEGKSALAAQLARRLAQMTPAVLLLDANFARPAHGGAAPGPGLAELLAGSVTVEQVLHPMAGTAEPRPMLVAAGRAATPAACLLASGAAADLLAAARARFAWIVIDGGASGDGPEAGLWANLADCNLVVAAFAVTSRRRLRHTVDVLERAGAGGLAVVINRVPARQCPAALELWRPQATPAPADITALRQRA